MRAASLLGVFLVAKALLLWGREVQLSSWMPIAYSWQDLLVVLVFVALDLWAPKRRGGWLLYGAVVAYAAVNLPIGRLMSTPLTWPMLRAARSTLGDSIFHHVTLGNLALVLLVLLPGALLPFFFRKVGRRALVLGSMVAVPVILLGPYASSRVDTLGLDRNVIFALVTSAVPRVGSKGLRREWRQSPVPSDVPLASPDGSPNGSPAEVPDGSPNQLLGGLSRFRGALKGRNVILVSLESTGARYLGLYGAAADPMPNLSRLKDEAIVFESAYAVYPESIKGLFSVLSSLYPALDVSAEAHGRVKSPSLAAVLSSAGYRTGLFHSGRFMYLGMDSIVKNRGFEAVEDAGDIGGDHNSSFGVDEPSAVNRILAWIDRLARGERFFVMYLPIAGHHPYETPEKGPFPERDEMGRYLNALHYGDQALGKLLEGLRARGVYEDTLFVVYGDHGEAFQQHEGNYGHTFFLYEENVRVPYLILLPGLLRAEVRVGRLVSLLDTAPTVLDLLGLKAPPEFQGSSLLDAVPRMAPFFTDYSLGFLGLRDGKWKFLHEVEAGRSKLFNLLDDPGEKKDLSEQFPERVGAYREHLLAWSASQREMILGLGK
jgi:arylsulfatase A-like enzyme